MIPTNDSIGWHRFIYFVVALYRMRLLSQSEAIHLIGEVDTRC